MKGMILLVLLITLLLFSGCSQKKPDETGTLKGHVTIGPLCPVESCPLNPTALAKAYELRKIMVYQQDKTTLVKTVDIGDDGNYKTALDPGTYVVDINHLGIDHSGDVPKEIVIEKGKTVELDVNIDTGIR